MGYDRYENRYGRERGGGYRDEGYGRERGGYDRDGGRGNDRGWMERAGEQVRGWFAGDDDDHRGSERGEGERYGGREGVGVGGYAGGDRDRGGWERSDREGRGGYRGGYGRQGGRRHEPEVGGQAYGGQGAYRPIAGDYGRGGGDYADTYRGGGGDFGHREGARYGATGYGDRNYGNQDAQNMGQRSPYDPHYQQWRERQMSELDRDYHEYRTENQQRFEEEFHSWRTARQGQRQALAQVREHQEVVGDDGQHVGTVDKVRGDQLILTRNDPAAGGKHHAIPSSWIQGVGEKVMLNRSAEKARGGWRDWEGEHAREESRGGSGMGQREGQGITSPALGHERDRADEGPHVLERSFSGTYDRKDERNG